MNLALRYRESAESLQPFMTTPLRQDVQEMYRHYLGDLGAQIGSAKALDKNPRLRALRTDLRGRPSRSRFSS